MKADVHCHKIGHYALRTKIFTHFKSNSIYLFIPDQKWWQDRVAAEKAQSQPESKAAASAPTTRGRGAPARGPQRGAAAARGRAAPASRGTAPSRGAPAARGRGTAVRGTRGRGGVAAPTASSSNVKCDKPEPTKPAEVNLPALVLATTAYL